MLKDVVSTAASKLCFNATLLRNTEIVTQLNK